MIKVENLVGGYKESPIIRGLELEIKKGEFFALLGPNGSGKTTLFKLITGQLSPTSGSILLEGKPLSSFSKLEKAKKIAVLAQEMNVTFDYTVEEIISLGRYPHQKGMFKRITKSDKQVMEAAMETTKVTRFRDSLFRSLSGGEKQRVLLAKALSQQPELLLLDEPTNHLDIKHTFEMLDQLKEWQRSEQLTVFAILHDLNIASLYADRIGLLHNGKLVEVGDVQVMKKEKQLQKVYDVDIKAQSHPYVAKPQLLLTPEHYKKGQKENVLASYRFKEEMRAVHIHFDQPFRVFSNITSGVHWFSQFVIVEKNDRNRHTIDENHTGMIVIEGQKEKSIQLCGQKEGVDFIVVITKEKCPYGHAFHLNVFMDTVATDGQLFDYYAAATEAKMIALDGEQMDRSFDTLLIATSQQGDTVTKEQQLLIKNQLKNTIIDAMNQLTRSQSFIRVVK